MIDEAKGNKGILSASLVGSTRKWLEEFTRAEGEWMFCAPNRTTKPIEPSAETMAAWLEFSQTLRSAGIQIGKQRDVYVPSKTCFEIAYAGVEGRIRFENNGGWFLTLSNDAFSLDVLAYGKIPWIKLETASLPEECNALELATGLVRQLTGAADTADEFEI